MADPCYGFARARRFLTKAERINELFNSGFDTSEILTRMLDACPELTEGEVYNALARGETERPDMRSDPLVMALKVVR